ncbi:MAG: glycosyltransferase, partial [Flavobacterium sp.]
NININNKLPFSTRVHGYINKANPIEVALLINLYKKAHFVFVPSFAECFGLVFNEANCFGVPSVTRDTGGVNTTVQNGYNGIVLPFHANTDDYTDAIFYLINNPALYQQMSLNAYDLFQKKLNWEVAGENINRIIHKLGS